MEKLTRAEMIALVERIMQPDFPEEEDETAFDALTRSTGNPHVSNLIFYPEPGKENLTAEEIVDLALAYRPIAL
ncbi:bacteriocin immunity protein [Lentzea nigeriaca]|uniref:bacteriocin immunity protein n=1 Tax=Lentzea nigeriaca TaxID=1128665 RepID=UPI001959FEC6|nr:bacteriocin immunity protein [Lentzea nigeriaca]MBM7856510.1 hypothetical protein [Lentzea nigeriaca]